MEGDIQSLFSEVGQLGEVFLPVDRDTGRPRGFAFVEFIDEASVAGAIEKFDGYQLNGRSIRVSKAEEKQPRQSRFADSGPNSNYQSPRASKPKGSRRNIRASKRGY
ncbi:MAG: RNA-binding protein [Chloroflexi bacterium]|jgi:RNA recognition motif-containing protein|nr:RNA-binding protein [Chloroflexota bacterium]